MTRPFPRRWSQNDCPTLAAEHTSPRLRWHDGRGCQDSLPRRSVEGGLRELALAQNTREPVASPVSLPSTKTANKSAAQPPHCCRASKPSMAAAAVGSPGAPGPGPDLSDPPRLNRRRLDQTRATSLWKNALSTESEARHAWAARHAMPWLKVIALTMLCVSSAAAVALELWSFARTGTPPEGSACSGRGCRIGR